MKVLIYSDLHCSYTSSILPLYSGKKDIYTTRLRMIIETGEWLSSLAAEKNVNLIINGGDTFDSTIVKTEELNAIREFFEKFEKLSIDHFVIVGNHEKVNENFNASTILSGFKNITVIKEPQKINEFISVLPYVDSKEINSSILTPISNQLLVSHIDIQGSCLRDSYILDSGVNPELLAEFFEFTANGHLHTAELLETTKNSVWNIGGVSSISFVDNQEYIPSAVIYDTESKSFERFNNPNSILFRRASIDSVSDLMKFLKNLDKNYKYVLMVKYTNVDSKSEIETALSKNRKILAWKLVNTFIANPTKETVGSVDLVNLDVPKKFTEFLETIELPYPKAKYKEILEDLGEE